MSNIIANCLFLSLLIYFKIGRTNSAQSDADLTERLEHVIVLSFLIV